MKKAKTEGANPKWRIRTRAPKNKTLKQKQTKLRQLAERQMPVADWVFHLIGALLVTLIVETLSRRSLEGAFKFIIDNPLAFLLNYSLIATVVSIALMFKRRVFALALSYMIWIALAMVNYTIMSRRGRLALYPADLHGIGDGIVVIPKLFTWWQVALIAGAATLVVAGLLALLLRTRKFRRSIKDGALRLVSTALVFCVTLLICRDNNLISRNLRPDFYASYKKNGFSYSFLFGLFDTGMSVPTNYNQETVDTIQAQGDKRGEVSQMRRMATAEQGMGAERLGLITENGDVAGYSETAVESIEGTQTASALAGDYPNIIFLQLEAFCEPEQLYEYAYEGEAIPNYKRLSEEYTSGLLGVPTVAGGTCNTEFEVLTGCNLDLFGANEYPYYGLVKENEFESLAQELRPFGYTSTFLHNYSGTFYSRNIVYSNFGFDRFASIEYMNGYEKTEVGWSRDAVLKDYILKSLETTPGKDFIMTVGVQTHSSYPELSDEEATFIATAAPDGNEADRQSFQFYLEQMHDVDNFLGELVDALNDYDEKVMLVIYGDHLPGLRLNHDKMTTEELFSTSYVIWTNYELEPADRDLEAYQLGAYMLRLAGINSWGAMVTVHDLYMDDDWDSYLNKMSTIEYDITYGDKRWYEQYSFLREKEMSFGVTPISVDGWDNDASGNLFVHGSGFTHDARVYINGSSQNTIFVGDDLLIVQGRQTEETDVIDVRFFGDDGVLLSTHTLLEPETVEENTVETEKDTGDESANEKTDENAGENSPEDEDTTCPDETPVPGETDEPGDIPTDADEDVSGLRRAHVAGD